MLCSVTQSCPALCDPIDYSLPGSSIHGIFQARFLEWVAISYFRESCWPRDQTHISCVALVGRFFITGPPGNPLHMSSFIQSCLTFAAPWIAAHQASLSSTISQNLLKFISVESVILSNHLIFCHPLLLPLIFPSIRVFSNESTLRMRWPKYWSFSFSIILQYKIKTLKKDTILTTVIVCLLLRQMLHHHWTHPDLCSQARKEIKLPFVHVTQC